MYVLQLLGGVRCRCATHLATAHYGARISRESIPGAFAVRCITQGAATNADKRSASNRKEGRHAERTGTRRSMSGTAHS